ncbi:MAG: DUF4190 domain-containing protein [Anaerolineaceae bacterium]|nr:DUF4190 domain-containing protein [Anaerolineaceae bacterium]
MTVPPSLDIPPQTVVTRPPSLQTKDSSLALASLITGILGWTILPLLGSVVAIITGHLAKKEIKESYGTISGSGMASAGLILGYVQLGFFVLAVLAIIVLLLLFPVNNLFG